MGDTVITDQDMSDDERRAQKWPDADAQPEPGKAAGQEDQPATTAKTPDHGQREGTEGDDKATDLPSGRGAANRSRSNPRA